MCSSRSDVAWSAIRELRKNTINLLQNVSKGLADNQSDEYISIVLRQVKELDVNPYTEVETILKKELSA